MHEYCSNEPVINTSDEDSSGNSCSDHDEGVVESDYERDITPAVAETGNGGAEVRDLDYGGA